ncbi:MAG: RluA family pseudouridine synthase [Acidobacteria bacterium]|jgi:23S rRNA pseudouridine1911/1915/1917 synthase|nr:RluA family pseudouridine synthase [Acidobacteriota bacterium]
MDERIVIRFSEAARRLDIALARELAGRGVTRSRVSRLLDEGRITLEGRKARASEPVASGQEAVLLLPPDHPAEPVPSSIELKILYEDEHCLVIDKPAGMVTHPAKGHWEGTVVNALVGSKLPLSPGYEPGRPGILHRLDKETSGLLLIAKSDSAQAYLASQFSARTVTKLYTALVWGHFEQDFIPVDAPIARDSRNRKRMAVRTGGRPSRTDIKVIERLPFATLVEARLLTGRTHQIRVHLAHLHHPVVGDVLYGGPIERGIPSIKLRQIVSSLDRFLLHARRLEFQSPSGKMVSVESPLPDEFVTVLEAFRHG